MAGVPRRGAPLTPDGLARALAAVDAHGGFFALGPVADRAGGVPLPDWLAGVPGGADVRLRALGVREAVAARAGVLPADVDARAAQSAAHLAVTSRVASPLLGLAAHGGVLAVPEAVRVRPDAGAVAGVTLEVGAARPAASREVVDTLSALLRAWAVTVHEATGLSRRVIAGNTASAVFSVPVVLAVTGAPVGVVRRAHELRLALLGPGGPLAGAAEVRCGVAGVAAPADYSLRRHNCCLYYRLPGGALCGDCVLMGRRAR